MRVMGAKRRHIAECNLALCFPEKSSAERARIVRENFYSTALAFFETGMAWFWPAWRLRSLCKIEGLDYLQAAEGQGVLLLAMHFTHLDIGAAFINMHISIDGTYRPHKNPVFDYVQTQGRKRHSRDSQLLFRQDVRGTIRALQQGRKIWYAPDQDYGAKRSIFVPFFNIPAATVTATSKFARLGRAKVIPFTQTRLSAGKGYRVVVYPPLPGFPSGDDKRDALQVNAFIEARVREQVGQYMWVHRRFKSRPPGERDVYQLAKPKRRKRSRQYPKEP